MIVPDFRGATTCLDPFPTLRVPSILGEDIASAALGWLKVGAPWRLRIADFYEQYEFSLLACELPSRLRPLKDAMFVDQVAEVLGRELRSPRGLQLTDITAHRLEPGQTIRIHNDFLGEEESHRLLIQLNDGWSAEMGGLLMLFSSGVVDDVSDVIVPEHDSGFGFEISPRSHHAVSTVHAGERYTLVYTFRQKP